MVAGAAFIPPAMAAPADSPTSDSASAHRADNRPGPLTQRQDERRKAAQDLILSGQASPNEDGVVALNNSGDKFYQAAVTGTGRLFTRSWRSSATRAAASSAPCPDRCTTRSPSPTAP